MKRLKHSINDNGEIVINKIDEDETSITIKVIGKENDFTIIATSNNKVLKVGEWTISIKEHPIVYSSFYRNAYLIFDACLNGQDISLQILILLDGNDNEVIKLSPQEITDYFAESLNVLAEQTSIPNMIPVVENICWIKKYPV